MTIFLSWSKTKSKELANAIFLEGMFRDQIKIWMSSESISFGAMSMLDINEALKNSDKCIAFITEENINAPWIMYETGAVASKNYLKDKNENVDAVIPIVFDDILDTAFSGHPLNQFQRMHFNKLSVHKLIRQLNDKIKAFPNESILNTQFNLNWNVLNKSVHTTMQKFSLKNKGCVNCEFLIEAFEKEKQALKDEIIAVRKEIAEKEKLLDQKVAEYTQKYVKEANWPFGSIIRYDSGFETQKLYDILLKNADKRLYFFGRKNRKLFSAENRCFFDDLNRRKKNGFDFKCLFIDPNCSNVDKAQKGQNFHNKLIACLREAVETLLQHNINPKEICRMYSCERTDQIILIDNVILYSHITYADDDYPYPLTKAPFYVMDIDTPIGQKYYKQFSDVWNISKDFMF